MERSQDNKEPGLIVKILVKIIRIYQTAVSPFFSRRCRFYPSCSHYFIDALKVKGILKGTLAGVWRIARCNPFNAGGYDPVKIDKE